MKDRVSLKADPEKVEFDNTAFLGLGNEIIGIPESETELSPEDFDKQLKEDVAALEAIAGVRAHGYNRDPGKGTAREAGCSGLDTLSAKHAHVVVGVKRPRRTRINKRIFSRAVLGLMIPGRYYFLTLTSSAQSPKLEKSWNAWRQWLKRYRPGIVWIYCFTDEGYGVIHMLVRLGMRQKMMVKKEISEAWSRIHAAPIVDIKRVRSGSEKTLANYIADQRKLRGMAGKFSYPMSSEMSYQQTIIRWRWSKGWIPQGFMKKFGKFWYEYCNSGLSKAQRDKDLRAWVQKEHLQEMKYAVGGLSG